MPAKAQFYHQKARPAKLFARLASCDLTPRDHPVQLAGYALRKAPVFEVLDPIEKHLWINP